MNLHKMIQIEADRLEKEVRELEKRLEKAPKGSLRCHKNGKNFRWYYIDEKDHREKEKNAKRKYISKRTGRSLAEKLARKAYVGIITLLVPFLSTFAVLMILI